MPENRRVAQACAVPYRCGRRGLEFCLITTRNSFRWSFPKGRIGRNETVVEAALIEAFEEAGLLGKIVGQPLGRFECTKRNGIISVTAMLMAVEHISDDWKEANERCRIWATAPEAHILLERPNFLDLLEEAIARLKQLNEQFLNDSAIRA